MVGGDYGGSAFCVGCWGHGRADESISGGDAVVGCGSAHKAKVSLGAAAEVAADRFGIGFAFSFEFGKAGVGWVARYLCQRWMLEESLAIINLSEHCRFQIESAACSVTKMNQVIKLSKLEL